MKAIKITSVLICLLIFIRFSLPRKPGEITSSDKDSLERISYHHPGLSVDLGVGLWAWPLPMDYDQDGDLDLLVSCPDVPFNGLYIL